jgi:hypothetical protein
LESGDYSETHKKAAKSGLFSHKVLAISGLASGWLGREGSNLRMAESKSAWLFDDFNAHLEKMPKMPPSIFTF